MKSKIAVLLIAMIAFQMVCLAAKKPVPMTDDTIADQVMLKLTSDPVVKGGGLKVDVKQGVVTLTGTVEIAKQHDKAESLARKVKGVKSVVNKIEVKARVPGR